MLLLSACKPGTAPVAIRYNVEKAADSMFGALTAVAPDGVHRIVEASEEKCLEVTEQRDFDGDGATDALITHSAACGGNCCPNTFFFVSRRGNKFVRSDEFADSWSEPPIEKWSGQWSVVVTSNNEGINQDAPVEFTRRFVLKEGKAVMVEERRREDLKSLVEMRSAIFNPTRENEKHSIRYDLDGDGRPDTIEATLWERWGRMFWSVRFGNGREFSSNEACKRIGVLASRTKGVSDLVCDQDKVLHWNGNAYE